MASPHEALEQLLSPVQADILDRAGRDAWTAAASALGAVLGQTPGINEVTGRLAMPDEIVAEFSDRHLVVPVELSTSRDQQATAYVVLPTPIAAMFFDSRADNPDDEEQQTLVMVSTIVGQLLQSINAEVFGASPEGLLFSLGDIVADQMPAVLSEMEDACLHLNVTLQGGRMLPMSLVLGGTFLDIVGTSFTPRDQESGAAGAAPAARPRDEDEPGATAGSPAGERVAGSSAPGERPLFSDRSAGGRAAAEEANPTPITSAPTAQRAQFGPLTEPAHTGSRANIELLSDLQMEVSRRTRPHRYERRRRARPWRRLRHRAGAPGRRTRRHPRERPHHRPRRGRRRR
ncbi:MAG: hypothetical protein U5Q44_13045 [Dehalococcoidia bacterium]|nr:hypothetical protein [Dehalococcoidia bacterium]